MIIVNNRDKVEWQENMTVQDVLDAMEYDFNMITVTVNEKYVDEEDYDETTVPDNANISVFHLAHGG